MKVRVFPYMDGDQLVELVDRREYDKLQDELNAAKVSRCDWKQDGEGNWDTSCKQCMCFEYGPPNEQGYKFCHHCGATINYIQHTEEELA